MNKKYHLLCKIIIQHSYFSEGHAQVSLEPTMQCSRLMQQYDLRIREIRGGLELYYGETGGKSFLQLMDKVFVLNFILRTSDPYWSNYTDLPLLENRNKMLFFSNTKTATSSKGNTLLHQNEWVSPANYKPFHSNVYVSALSSTSNELEFKLIDPQRSIYSEQQVSGWSILPKEEDRPALLEMNLDTFAIGDYSLEIDDVVQGFLHIPQSEALRSLGLVELVVGEVEAEGESLYLLQKDDQVFSATYEISFKARETVWRYYLVNQNEIDTETIMVKEGMAGQANGTGKEVNVVRPIQLEEKELSNGEKATLVELQDARALRKVPTDFLHLTASSLDPGTGEENTLSLNLPLASGAQIFPKIQESQITTTTEEKDYLLQKEQGVDLEIMENPDAVFPKQVKIVQHVYSDIYVYL